MANDANQRAIFEFFLRCWQSKSSFTKEELRSATTWSASTVNTYWSKQLKPFVAEVDENRFEVADAFLPFSTWDAFRPQVSQVRAPDLSKHTAAEPLGSRLLVATNSEAADDSGTRQPWSAAEIEATVVDYFAMFREELDGRPYSKAEHRRALRQQLDGRSDGAIEFKRENISAILIELGLPFIEGYKPSRNYQSALRTAVTDFLQTRPQILGRLGLRAGDLAATTSDPGAAASVFVDAPQLSQAPASAGSRVGALIVDYAERDARNVELGRRGEEFVIELERRRLSEAGRPDLADKLEWVSNTRGDGLGYDVRSYAEDGSPVYIEVKTTNYGKLVPFIVSANEVAFSVKHPSGFRLYRVFAFSMSPRVFVLQGRLDQRCHLRPNSFEAHF